MKQYFFLITGLLLAAIISKSCQKPAAGVDPGPVSGDWKLSALLQVNDSTGTPRDASAAALDCDAIHFERNGSFSLPDGSAGSWNLRDRELFLTFNTRKRLKLRVSCLREKSLLLAQHYPPSGTKAGGVVWYAFNR